MKNSKKKKTEDLQKIPQFRILKKTKPRKTNEIQEVIHERLINAQTIRKSSYNHHDEQREVITYYNIPCAFDIETTSFYYGDGEKGCCMYHWQLGLNGDVITGRTWDDFVKVLETISATLNLDRKHRLVIYVHNLAFEFQFMRKWFNWLNVFATGERKPVYAITNMGIEFRCSYILSGYSLAEIGKHLQKYKVDKMVGDLDYSLIRSPATPLDDTELQYCINDVLVVMAYIQERIEEDGNITKIPLTKTGYVRNYVRNYCLYDGNHKKNTWKFLNYHSLMQNLSLSVDEYFMLKDAFQGGFTHQNGFWVNKICTDVKSQDETSAYPYAMMSEQYPMSRGEEYVLEDKEDFERVISLYCCIFEIEFINIRSKFSFEHPIAESKIHYTGLIDTDNGRVVNADHIITTITEIDYHIIKEYYTFSKFKIRKMVRYRKSYLPRNFILAVLDLYEKKTTLKGVAGEETDYMRSKEMLNSCYGMCVTDILQQVNEYVGDKWKEPTKPDAQQEIEKYNVSMRRFLSYVWGVYVTAYSRRNLFRAISELREDFVYCDTDSVKYINYQKHEQFFINYNKECQYKLAIAFSFNQIPLERMKPKTIKGEEKIPGTWDDEGVYTRFKCLGQKRYMTEKDGKIDITVAGVNKNTAVPYLKAKYGKYIFDAFTNDLFIPAVNDLGKDIFDKNGIKIDNPTGKLTHTYIDDIINTTITDYYGMKYTIYEKSGIHLEPAEYSLSMTEVYLNYLRNIQTETNERW